nr:serine hydrolase domain-containing protein [uncultured Allomuricauda sp.]
MDLRKLLFAIILIVNIGTTAYSQTLISFDLDTIQQRIKKVENSLGPLVLNKDETLRSLEEQMQKYNIPGLSIAVINNYEIEWAKAYGETGNPKISNVTKQTVFQAASMSKFVSAVAIMKLKELKQIDLDKDINQYLTSWKFPYSEDFGTDPITIRQLLAHTAGLSTHGFIGYKNSDKLPTIIQTLEGNKTGQLG